MRIMTISFLLAGILILGLNTACKNEPKAKEESAPDLNDYVGRYDIIEAPDSLDVYVDVFLKNDTLYSDTPNEEPSQIFHEGKEIFHNPTHDVRAKFIRDKSGNVQRIAFLLDGKLLNGEKRK